MQEYDMFVIGSGPAGQRAAVQAAKLGQRVGIAERKLMLGGVCINTGTLPSKTLREAVLYLSGLRQRGIYGSSYTVKEKLTMEDLLFRCNHVIQREIEIVRAQLRRNGIQILNGSASFIDDHHLRIENADESHDVAADKVVIATGTTPSTPDCIEVDHHTVITSDGVMKLKDLPRSMTVVGAGVIGLEYASIFAAAGVEVTLIDKRSRLLDFVDAEIVESLSYQMRNSNCTFRLGEEVQSITIEGPGRSVARLQSGKKVVSELLLFSIGRVGATSRLALDKAGLKADSRGRLNVNGNYQTDVAHIYAVGDVIGFPSLASTSMEQGRLAACHACDHPTRSVPELFPYGIYAVPEISMVGEHEEQLTAKQIPYEVGVARYREIARGAILGDDSGMLKILFHRHTRRLLGVHIIGVGATELIHIGQAVMALGGTIDYFVNSVFNYPTLAECYKVAALDGYNKVGPDGDSEHSGFFHYTPEDAGDKAPS